MEIDSERGVAILTEEEAFTVMHPGEREMPIGFVMTHFARWRSSNLAATANEKAMLAVAHHGPLHGPDVVAGLERNGAVIANMGFVLDAYQEKLLEAS